MHKVFATMVMSLGAAVLMSGTAMAGDVEAAKTEDKPQEPKIHEVAPGDSLSLIAEAQQLENWLPLWNANPEVKSPDLIYPGQKLIVPQGPTEERPLPPQVMMPVPSQARTSGYVAKPAQRKATATNYAAGAGGILERIRMRESGGNYATNTGNGYYGAYQFDLPTWRSNGGTGLPSEASPAEQDMRAQMLYDRRGCNPWPNTCR
jgi:LysM repeat protein